MEDVGVTSRPTLEGYKGEGKASVGGQEWLHKGDQ